MSKTVAVVMLVCFGLTLLGCGKEAPVSPPAPTVTVAQPVMREVVDYDDYTGYLKAAEEVNVQARVRGYLDSIGFRDGDHVEKGQVLFQIDPRPFEAQVKMALAQVDVLKARRVKAEADVRRYRELVPKGAATAQDLDRAIGELGEAEAGIRAAEAEVEQAKLDLEYSTLRAPVDGLASRAMLTVGNLIGASGGEQLLTTIAKVDPIHVYFDVDQRALQRYQSEATKRRGGAPPPKTIRELNIAFEFGLAGEQGFPHKGVLDFFDNKVDPTTGTIALRGQSDNPQGFMKPGYFARVRLAPSPPYQALLVAERAIGTQQGQKYLLIVGADNKVAFRPVQLGAPQPDGLRVITSGVKPGERIVVNGMQRARPGAIVTPEPGDMLPQTASSATTQQVTVGH